MKRTGSSRSRSAVRRRRLPALASSSSRAAAGGHERVLGRDEHRIPQHEQENDDDAEGVAHAPFSGARVLGGISSSKSAF